MNKKYTFFLGLLFSVSVWAGSPDESPLTPEGGLCSGSFDTHESKKTDFHSKISKISWLNSPFHTDAVGFGGDYFIEQLVSQQPPTPHHHAIGKSKRQKVDLL